ncbi:MAG TPA: site-2 protease family protein [Bryobacteraceae bacterium]|jgi:regulator of sigma E protease
MILLSVMILVHELGHFLAALVVGVKVETFSIGFGPKLFGFRVNGTEFRVSAVPFGGYVRTVGHQSRAETAAAPQSKTRWQRAVVIIAGPMANILLAIGITAGLYMCAFPKQVDTTDPIITSIKAGSPDPKHGIGVAGWSGEQNLRVGEVEQGSPATRAGLRAGDLLVTANGQRVTSPFIVQQAIFHSDGKPVNLGVIRNGHLEHVIVSPAASNDPKMPWRIGISFRIPVQIVKLRLGPALAQSLRENWKNALMVFQVLRGIIEMRVSPKSVSGPIGIAQISREAANAGIWSYLFLMAFLSLQLAIFNFLPIPILDGGTLLILIIEILLQREITVQAKELIFKLGFVFLIIIIALTIYNDISRLFSGT